MNTNWTDATLLGETAKAYRVELGYDSAVGQRGYKTWVPKSCVEAVNSGWMKISDWFLDKKAQEIGNGFYTFIQSSEAHMKVSVEETPETIAAAEVTKAADQAAVAASKAELRIVHAAFFAVQAEKMAALQAEAKKKMHEKNAIRAAKKAAKTALAL